MITGLRNCHPLDGSEEQRVARPQLVVDERLLLNERALVLDEDSLVMYVCSLSSDYLFERTDGEGRDRYERDGQWVGELAAGSERCGNDGCCNERQVIEAAIGGSSMIVEATGRGMTRQLK